MQLETLDWAIIVAYFVLVLGVGVLFSKRAGSSMTEYFLSGRSLPWWIAGTSMVATTFAADTPLAVTELVAKHGLAGNWLWWAFAMGGMFTVFVYARLWRRAEVVTDVELIELRYGGRPASFLRGFRSLYIALLINSIIIGWVTKAILAFLGETVFHGAAESATNDWLSIAVMLIVVGIYSTLSGLWGVAITDIVQFVLAMGGCIAMAAIAVDHVGGIDALQARVTENLADGGQVFRLLPDFTAENAWMPLNVFLIMVFVQWWASWYPGAEPGGGGYIVQRMASCRSERDSVLATLWYQVAHYCVRPWPWLLVAFAALAMHPELREWALDDDPETYAGSGFPMLVRELAPPGLVGLMLVAFFAAFMSTISTQMNWGASYLVNDVYKRFVKPDASERQLTRASRVASVIVLIAGGIAAYLMRDTDITAAWNVLLALGAGTGAVFMLRWFWWRINAWSEIAAMVGSLVFFLVVREYVSTPQYQLALVAGLTIVTWLIVTFVTAPESDDRLLAFYRKVRPGGSGWAPIARIAPEVRTDRALGVSVLTAIVASGIVYCTIPGVGALIFGDYPTAAVCLAGTVGCSIAVLLLVRHVEARNAR